jgi:hypothetical protein
MRSCKFPTSTRIIFRTTGNIVVFADPELLTISEFVTVTFVNRKMDGRWTPGPNVAPGDPDLSPSFATLVVQRILERCPT